MPANPSGDDQQLPWEDIQASRRNRRLQAKHPVTKGKNYYLAGARSCRKCHTPADSLSWFYFESPKETWPELCGVAGWVVVCDGCRVQVDFFIEVMS
jgi:hypothetical protein